MSLGNRNLPVVVVVHRDAVELHEHPRGQVSSLVGREPDRFRLHHVPKRTRPRVVAVRVLRHLFDCHWRQRGGVGTLGPQRENMRGGGVGRALLKLFNVVRVQFRLFRSFDWNKDRLCKCNLWPPKSNASNLSLIHRDNDWTGHRLPRPWRCSKQSL